MSALLAHGFPKGSLGLAKFPRIGQAEPITEPRDETIYTEHLGSPLIGHLQTLS